MCWAHTRPRVQLTTSSWSPQSLQCKRQPASTSSLKAMQTRSLLVRQSCVWHGSNRTNTKNTNVTICLDRWFSWEGRLSPKLTIWVHSWNPHGREKSDSMVGLHTLGEYNSNYFLNIVIPKYHVLWLIFLTNYYYISMYSAYSFMHTYRCSVD